MMHTMMQACREVEMSYQTLKFYSNQGLAHKVKRDKARIIRANRVSRSLP